MKTVLATALFITALCAMLGLIIGGNILAQHLFPGQVKVYDCSLAEISPDYPPEVRNQCRKVRMEKI